MRLLEPACAVRWMVALATCVLSSPALAAPSKGTVREPVTYCKHIAPILWKNCAGCHRPGEVGPFSLLTYEDAKKRAEFLSEVTASHRMPPWKAEPDFGKFHDERRLSEAEIKLIASWAESGAPEGDRKDLPKPPKFVEGWQLGKPDLVLEMPQGFEIPADGRDIYRCFVVPIPGDKDRMVSAVEFRPGNRKVVHHAIMFLDSHGEARKKDKADAMPGFESFGGPGIKPTGGLGGWAPGAVPRPLAPGIVKYLRKGSDLVLQIHYHPSGKAETDQSSVGIYFSKVATQKIVTGIAVMQTGLQIPAGDAHCEIKAETEPLPVDVSVVGISPHMHNLGREMKVTAIRPDRENPIPLVWIKDWDFNWQGQYQFQKPIRLPKGSRIIVESVYDNSADNPKNPNSPPKPVHWGEQTSDEMCLCSVAVYTDKIPDLKQVARMRGNELGAGLDGGIPGASTAVKKEIERTAAAKRHAAKAAEKSNAAKKARDKHAPTSDGDTPPVDASAASTAPVNTAGGDAVAPMPPAAAPAETPPAAEPAAPAAPLVAAKKRDKEPSPFPSEGIAITDEYRVYISKFDTDGDGRLSPSEFAQIEPGFQITIRKTLDKRAAK